MAEDRYSGERAISERRARFWNILIWTVVVLVVLLIIYLVLGMGSDEEIGIVKNGR